MKRKIEAVESSENNLDMIETFKDMDIEGMEWILNDEFIEKIKSERIRRAVAVETEGTEKSMEMDTASSVSESSESESSESESSESESSESESMVSESSEGESIVSESSVDEKKQFIKLSWTESLWTAEPVGAISGHKKRKNNGLSVFAQLQAVSPFQWSLENIETRARMAMPPIQLGGERCKIFLPKKVVLNSDWTTEELMRQVSALPKGHYIQFPNEFDVVLAKDLIEMLPEYRGFCVSNEIKDILYPEPFPENIFFVISNNVSQYFAFYSVQAMNSGKIYFEPGHNNAAVALAVMDGIRKSQKNCKKIIQISPGCSDNFLAAVAENLPEFTEIFINPTLCLKHQVDIIIDNLKNKSTVLFLNTLAPAWESIQTELNIFYEYLLTQICNKWPDTITITEDESKLTNVNEVGETPLTERTSENEHAFFRSVSKQDKSAQTDLDLGVQFNQG